ncbi:MAG: hypothetical protein ACK6DA_11950 [Candidatus Kapaibacterium sp.]|jgi:hypothetical protein
MKITVEVLDDSINFDFTEGTEAEYAEVMADIFSVDLLYFFINNKQEQYQKTIDLLKEIIKNRKPVVNPKNIFKTD